ARLRGVAEGLTGVEQALRERGDVERSSALRDGAGARAALGREPASFDRITLIEALLHVAIFVHRAAAHDPLAPALAVAVLPVVERHRLGCADLGQVCRLRWHVYFRQSVGPNRPACFGLADRAARSGLTVRHE